MKTMESPPETFPFPFQPYDIQKDFMKQLYIALERGAVGIFESPTGTVFDSIGLIYFSVSNHNFININRVSL